jgi:hypothetical protein
MVDEGSTGNAERSGYQGLFHEKDNLTPGPARKQESPRIGRKNSRKVEFFSFFEFRLQLTQEHFERWLFLWQANCRAQLPADAV